MIVTFSEPLKTEFKAGEPFLFTVGSDNYRMKLSDEVGKGTVKKTFLVTDRKNHLPLNGKDSVALCGESSAADLVDNVQRKDTKFVPLKVANYPPSFFISAFPNPWRTKALTENQDQLEKLCGQRLDGPVFVLEPLSPISLNPKDYLIEVNIFDNLGNLVDVLKDNVIATETGRLCIPWDLRNKTGRSVASGSYMANVSIRSTADGADKTPTKERVMIGILR